MAVRALVCNLKMRKPSACQRPLARASTLTSELKKEKKIAQEMLGEAVVDREQ